MKAVRKICRFLKKVIKSDKKLFHIKRKFCSWYFLLINFDSVSENIILPRYFSSEQRKFNNWTFNQVKNYSKDFKDFFYSKNFLSDLSDLLAGLDEEDVNKLKFIFERMFFFSFLDRKNIFSDEEEEIWGIKKNIIKSVKKNEKYYSLFGYKFLNNNIAYHNFVDDLGLKKIKNIKFPISEDIIDAGAYVGDSSLILSNYTKGNVHAFEPFKKCFDELKINVDLNNSKIVPINMGLSNKNAREKLFFGENNLSISANDPDKALSKGAYKNVIEVENVTIDSYVRKNKLKIGVIKFDTEGAEQKILEGAKQTILTQKPILLISIYHNINDFVYIKPWLDNLNIGYKYKITKSESETFIEETMLVCY